MILIPPIGHTKSTFKSPLSGGVAKNELRESSNSSVSSSNRWSTSLPLVNKRLVIDMGEVYFSFIFGKEKRGLTLFLCLTHFFQITSFLASPLMLDIFYKLLFSFDGCFYAISFVISSKWSANTATIFGSNCVPLQRRISCRASSFVIVFL